MIVKQFIGNMATLFDHLNGNSLDKLNNIKKSYEEKEAKLEAEHRRILKEKAEKYGFKNYDEVIDWLKSGNCVNTIDGSIDYNDNDNLFYWTHQVGDEYDCNFWYVTDKYIEEKLRDHYNNLKEKYGDDLYDEFGYLKGPHKNI